MTGGQVSALWLTVVMPIYNGARTLSRTLDSLLGQQDGVEVVAVNQGSADGSRAILEGYRDRLNIVIIDAPQNVNWMQNTNMAMAAARAPLCTMLHQDDVWMPGRAKNLRQLAERYPDAGLWVHNAWFIDGADRHIGRFGPPFGPVERLVASDDALSKLLVQETMALPAVMFRRETALKGGGLDETLWYTADWDLWLRLSREGPVAWSPAYLAGFRLHGSSLTLKGSRNLVDFQNQLVTVLNRHIGALSDVDAARIRPFAEAAVSLNVSLAATYHRERGNWTKTLLRIINLGPTGMMALFRDTQILQRVISRIRARLLTNLFVSGGLPR